MVRASLAETPTPDHDDTPLICSYVRTDEKYTLIREKIYNG